MEDLWELIKTGNFAGAVAGYSRLLERPTSRSRIAYSNRAIAYLNLGDLAQAQSDFQSAGDLCDFPSGHYKSWVGVCQWLTGHESVGAQIWLDIVQSIAEGKICYTDGAGGVGDAALLWFAAVKLGDADLQRAACGFLQARIDAKGGRNWKIGNWPGPIGEFILDRSSAETLLDAVTQTPVRRERELCQACFYVAAKHLGAQDSERQQELLGSAAQVFVPHEQEFYLARYELDRARNRIQITIQLPAQSRLRHKTTPVSRTLPRQGRMMLRGWLVRRELEGFLISDWRVRRPRCQKVIHSSSQ